jgi:SAM-dependent methyltransferase
MTPAPDYDQVAPIYDTRFHSTIDQIEDRLLTTYFSPACDGANVLDLGCGTGLLRDLTRPNVYAGIDSSPGMLDRLTAKYPDAWVVHGDLSNPTDRFDALGALAPMAPFDAIVSVFAAHYFHSPELLSDLLPLLTPGGTVILHGQLPRYERRVNYIFNGVYHDHLTFIPAKVEADFREAGLTGVRSEGWNALNDRVAARLKPATLERLMRQSRRLPARWSYHGAVIGTWKPDEVN